MNFLPTLPEVPSGASSTIKSPKFEARRNKKRDMAKASRRMNRYQTKGGQKTKFKKALKVHG